MSFQRRYLLRGDSFHQQRGCRGEEYTMASHAHSESECTENMALPDSRRAFGQLWLQREVERFDRFNGGKMSGGDPSAYIVFLTLSRLLQLGAGGPRVARRGVDPKTVRRHRIRADVGRQPRLPRRCVSLARRPRLPLCDAPSAVERNTSCARNTLRRTRLSARSASRTAAAELMEATVTVAARVQTVRQSFRHASCASE